MASEQLGGGRGSSCQGDADKGLGGGTVSQIRGSGPINKYETLMMVGILMHMMMLRVMRG